MSVISVERRLLSRIEAANFVGIKPQTLAKWATIGYGPRFIKAGRSVRYAPAELERWLEQRTVGAIES